MSRIAMSPVIPWNESNDVESLKVLIAVVPTDPPSIKDKSQGNENDSDSKYVLTMSSYLCK